MKGWTGDLAACLHMMFDDGELFDDQRVLRAEAVLHRLHPRFAGSIQDRIQDELKTLAERGALEAVGSGVYRWLGLPPEMLAVWSARQATPLRDRLGATPAASPRPASPVPAPAPAPTSEDAAQAGFRAELRQRLASAAAGGKAHLHVAAFDLHRAVLPYPAPNHRMPACCQVMRAEMREGDTVLTAPKKGRDGPGLLIRYAVPR